MVTCAKGYGSRYVPCRAREQGHFSPCSDRVDSSCRRLFIYGFAITISSLLFSIVHFSLEIEAMKGAMAVAVEIIDLFLVATVFYIISLGLYELFIAKAPLPGWLKICNMDDLKEKLLGLVVIALAVLFLGESLVWPNSAGDLLVYGLANAAVIGAISLYFWAQH